MLYTSSKTSAVAVTLIALVTQVQAFWRMNCALIQTGRVDPVISFGTASSHVHKIAGSASESELESSNDSGHC